MEELARQTGYSIPVFALRGAREPHTGAFWGFACAYKNTGLGGGAPDKAGQRWNFTAMEPYRCAPRRRN